MSGIANQGNGACDLLFANHLTKQHLKILLLSESAHKKFLWELTMKGYWR